jgi:hypothetical protein
MSGLCRLFRIYCWAVYSNWNKCCFDPCFRISAYLHFLHEYGAFMKHFSLAFSILMGAGLVTGSALAALGQPGQVNDNNQSSTETKKRAELTYKIVKKWAPYVQEAYGLPAKKWAMEMMPLFLDSSPALMQQAADAKSFDAMNSLLLKTNKLGNTEALNTKLLGDVDKDLVFVPVAPCRILDTRLVGGVMPANTVRSFDVTAVTDYSFQGGAANNCGGVGAAGSFAIAAINFTVVNPVVGLTGGGLPGTGYISAYPFLTAQPLIANMVYKNDVNLSNLTLVKLDQGASANEMTVYTSHQTHLAADIVGYLINPVIPALECVYTANVSVDASANGGTVNAVAPVCATGYTQTATNCETTSWLMPVVYFKDGTCSARNGDTATRTIRASRTCCRIPGS